jgi:hypothetical protein
MNASGTVKKPGGHRLRTVSRESRLSGNCFLVRMRLIRQYRQRPPGTGAGSSEVGGGSGALALGLFVDVAGGG